MWVAIDVEIGHWPASMRVQCYGVYLHSTMTISCRIFHVEGNDSELIALWGEAVRENALPPQACYEWKTILENIFGANAFSMLALDSKKQVSGFALVFFKPGEGVLYSCRYGFFAKNMVTAIALRNEINAIAKKHNLVRAVITSGTNALELPTRKDTKASLYLPLSYPNEDSLWQSIPQKTKNMIRKAEKLGVTASFDWKHLEEFYTIYRKRLTKIFVGIKPLRYFQSIKDIFADDAVFVGAFQNHKLIAGMIFISTGASVSYMYNANVVSAAKSGANNLLMWEAMRYFHKKGAKYVDLSESQSESSVYKFKMRLSKDIARKQIYYYDFLIGAESGSSKKIPSRLGVKYKILGALHRLMPAMPAFVKTRYLQYLGANGRIL